MPSAETILVVALAGFALSATPGPSMLYVLSRSVGQNRAAGLASAIGLGIGGLLLAVIAALGLAVVFQQSKTAYFFLTIAGAIYLIYLGSRMIIEERRPVTADFEVNRVEHRSIAKIVWQGVLVEVLNPKTVLFFMAFIPPFVDMDRGDVTLQLLILGLLVPLTAMPSDIVVAVVGGSIAGAVRSNLIVKTSLSVIGGLFLIGIGISLFF
jgi:threonine/homoserine/homoserine lactone efflux protein